jgi:hypothetical protein
MRHSLAGDRGWVRLSPALKFTFGTIPVIERQSLGLQYVRGHAQADHFGSLYRQAKIARKAMRSFPATCERHQAPGIVTHTPYHALANMRI